MKKKNLKLNYLETYKSPIQQQLSDTIIGGRYLCWFLRTLIVWYFWIVSHQAGCQQSYLTGSFKMVETC